MPIRTAVIGIGNCASSLIQTIEAFNEGNLESTGISHEIIGNYRISDIEFVAAFDIDKRKVGKDLSEAILAEPNCTTIYHKVNSKGLLVSAGLQKDGIANHMAKMFLPVSATEQNNLEQVIKILKNAQTDVVVSYLPVGSLEASEFYAEAALRAGCAFINCTPSLVACDEKWVNKYSEAGLPLLGDDIKSQVGSTAVHRALIEILKKKGVIISSTYQLNVGGNSDFMNMRYPDRAATKKASKNRSLETMFKHRPEIGVGPSDYVPQLKDHKVGYINIEGAGLMGMPFKLEMKIQVEDSPNSAGVVVNAIRSAKTALDRRLSGSIDDACPWLFKSPPHPVQETKIFQIFDQFATSINN